MDLLSFSLPLLAESSLGNPITSEVLKVTQDLLKIMAPTPFRFETMEDLSHFVGSMSVLQHFRETLRLEAAWNPSV